MAIEEKTNYVQNRCTCLGLLDLGVCVCSKSYRACLLETTLWKENILFRTSVDLRNAHPWRVVFPGMGALMGSYIWLEAQYHLETDSEQVPWGKSAKYFGKRVTCAWNSCSISVLNSYICANMLQGFLWITVVCESLRLRVWWIARNKNLAEEAHTSPGVLTQLIVLSRKAGHVRVQRDVLIW